MDKHRKSIGQVSLRVLSNTFRNTDHPNSIERLRVSLPITGSIKGPYWNIKQFLWSRYNINVGIDWLNKEY